MVAIGRLKVRESKFRYVKIDVLEVNKLKVGELELQRRRK
jgi:hypothetical protein